MSNSNEHIMRAIDADVRYDGRKKHEYRPVSIEYGVSATAEGSAKVSIGDTEVIAGVKMELTKPYDDVPDDVSQDEIKAWAISDTKKHLLSIDREYGENFTIGEVEFS